MSINVYDNFLSSEDFNNISSCITSEDFPWYFSQYKVFKNEKDITDKNFQFTHNFYSNFSIQSSFFQNIFPIISKMEVLSLIRVRANLTTKWNSIEEFEPHVDNLLNGPRTAIFYLNTNNGYTKFIKEDRKINSVENRLITFPNDTLHCGSTHTNTKYRALININYFGQL